MSKDASARPPQATAAGWTVLLGGVLVVLTAFESVASLRSLETRLAVEEFLAEPPGSGLGIGTEGVLTLMHVLALVTGACAAAMAVLGWWVLGRSRPARVAVSVLAVPLFLAGTVVGGLLTAVVAAAVVLLWLPPARDWFAGRDWRPRARPGHRDPRGGRPDDRPSTPPRQPPAPLPPQDPDPDPDPERQPVHVGGGEGRPDEGDGRDSGAGGGAPRAFDGFGTPRATAQVPTAPGGQHAAPHHPAYATGSAQPRPPAPRRPAAVVTACAITWGTTALVGLLVGLTTVVMVASPDLVLDELARQRPDLAEQGLTRRMLVGSTLVVGGLVLLWCAAAAVLAALVFRGVAWARTALLVSAAASGALSLVASLDAFALVLPMLASAVVVACLLRPETRTWLRERAGDRGAMGA